MRVTIGERLGLVPRPTKVVTPPHSTEDVEGPSWRTEPTLRLSGLPSASSKPCRTPGKYCEGCECDYCTRRTRELRRQAEDLGPPRVRGEMVWLHKTAPTLVIEGQRDMSPEEHAAGRRR